MKPFYKLLAYGLIAATTNNFVWFALTYWAYLGTKSVIATAMVGGLYLVVTAFCGFWLGSVVDHHRKKNVMLGSSFITLVLFTLGLIYYSVSSPTVFTSVSSIYLWLFAIILMGGVIAGNVIGIAIPTLVTVLVEEKKRDKANGLFGTVMGLSFAITSFVSGIALAYGGMFWVLVIAILFTITAIVSLLLTPIPENKIVHIDAPGQTGKVDIKGTLSIVMKIPGLFALIIFTTFNNFLGGVFMALMDAYGLSLMPVQAWGALWGFLSFGFIFGGIYIAKKGLGRNPLRTLFRINVVMWVTCILFTIQPSIPLLAVGMLIWMCLIPFVEATEQTIVQKVVPQERQGRVFGFAQSVEQAASPITAFLIGPIAQFIFIPFMTTGKGVDLIGSWFGVGVGRGIALVFIIAGIVGLIVTLIAMRSNSYKLLSKRYLRD